MGTDRVAPASTSADSRESYQLLATSATVTGFLPVLSGRFARERPEAVARSQGLRTAQTPEVLFVCVHNAGRSQMAAAWMHELSGGRWELPYTGRTAGRAGPPDPRRGPGTGRWPPGRAAPRSVDRH